MRIFHRYSLIFQYRDRAKAMTTFRTLEELHDFIVSLQINAKRNRTSVCFSVFDKRLKRHLDPNTDLSQT